MFLHVLMLLIFVNILFFANAVVVCVVGTVIWDLTCRARGLPTVTDDVRDRSKRSIWFAVAVSGITALALGLLLGHLFLT